MADILTPEQVEAIRERQASRASGFTFSLDTDRRDIADLMAERLALTARAEAAERKVAAVRAITDERHEDMPGHDELCEHDDWVWLEEVVDRLDRIAAVLDE